MKILSRRMLRSLCLAAVVGCAGTGALLTYCYWQLPDSAALEDVQLQVPLRIFTQDGELIAEYGEKRRVPVTIENIPKPLVLAIIATEDRRFYEHPGVDARGLARAVLHFVRHGTKEQGGSTITMQVARNFFLTRKKTFTRKLNEILLALKIDRELSKDKILELYLNKIYFGKNAYGVAAAAQVYYGKPVESLSLAQMAMLAGLPQAPSAINPLNNPKAAKQRRNHVLTRMHHYGFISDEDYAQALTAPLTARHHGRGIELSAPYVAEAVRQELFSQYGDRLYTDGFVVYTTIHKAAQQAATTSVRKAILDYDTRHGYRGPVKRFALADEGPTIPEWQKKLEHIPHYPHLQPGVVVQVDAEQALVLETSGEVIPLSLEAVSWARPIRRTGALGAEPKAVNDVLSLGDVIYVTALPQGGWRLSQIPKIGAALVAMEPDSGAIAALVGGYDFDLSHFNRATQASRQPGSAFKAFIYAAALEQGFTPASIINDSPVVYEDSSLEDTWRPQNDSKQFYGPTRLREAMIKSRNLVSIRLLRAIGLNTARQSLARMGFKEEALPNGLSLALGTAHTTPLEMASAYSLFANGGFKVQGHLIHHIEDTQGNILFAQDPPVACFECEQKWPDIPLAEQVVSSQVAYMVTDILQDAIQRGTGRRAKVLGREDLAGKTGTTNDLHDNWFAGYNRDWVCITWMGFDDPASIQEYASQTSLPLWIDFMGTLLKGAPQSTLPQPPGLMRVRIDPESGLLAYPRQKDAIFEVFRQEDVPTMQANIFSEHNPVESTASLF